MPVIFLRFENKVRVVFDNRESAVYFESIFCNKFSEIFQLSDKRNPAKSAKYKGIERRKFLKGALVFSTALATTAALPIRALAVPVGETGSDLFSPKGVAFGPDGQVYVADAGNYCIRTFDAGGNLSSKIFGSVGTGAGELNYPCDVAVGADKIYALDTNNGRVCIYDLATGNFLDSFGSLGGSADKLFTPEGIAVHKEWAFVANTRSHTCQVWDPRGDNAFRNIGILGDEASTPKPGEADLRFRLPTAVAFDAKRKNIVISDSKHGRVVVTDWDGRFLWQFDGEATGQKLLRPQDIALSGDLLYVADTGNGRVVKVHLEKKNAWTVNGNWTEPVAIDVMDTTLAVADGKTKKVIIAKDDKTE